MHYTLSNSPFYFELNAINNHMGYFYVHNVFDQHFRPIGTSGINSVSYSSVLPSFTPIQYLYGNFITYLNNSNDKDYQIIRLALQFVEAIRFRQVRDAVQDSINTFTTLYYMPPVVFESYRNITTIITSWKMYSNRVLNITNLNYPNITGDYSNEPNHERLCSSHFCFKSNKSTVQLKRYVCFYYKIAFLFVTMF